MSPGGCSLHGQPHSEKDGGARRQHGFGAQRPGPRSVRRAFEQHHGGSERPRFSESDAGGPTVSDGGRGAQVKVERSRNWVGQGFPASVGSRPPSVRGAPYGHMGHCPSLRRPAKCNYTYANSRCRGAMAHRHRPPASPVPGGLCDDSAASATKVSRPLPLPCMPRTMRAAPLPCIY